MIESKFLAGAWMVVLAIPLLVLLMLGIRSHYRSVEPGARRGNLRSVAGTKPIVIVPIARLDEPARQALAFANSISPDAIAVHVTNDAEARTHFATNGRSGRAARNSSSSSRHTAP